MLHAIKIDKLESAVFAQQKITTQDGSILLLESIDSESLDIKLTNLTNHPVSDEGASISPMAKKCYSVLVELEMKIWTFSF